MTSTASFARRWQRLLTIAVMGWGFLAGSQLYAQTPKPTEYEVEAAYLSHFGGFVEWPARVGAATDPFYVCVLGQDPLARFSRLHSGVKRLAVRRWWRRDWPRRMKRPVAAYFL